MDHRWEGLLARTLPYAGDHDRRVEGAMPGREGQTIQTIKFRKIEEGEDADTYLTMFEAQMDTYRIDKSQWSSQLSPHLSAEATDVFVHMTREDRNDYEKLKKALLEHYRINPDTYRSRLDKMTRKSGQAWAVTANKARQMYSRWLGKCSTLEDAIELGTIDGLTKMIPHQLRLYVKEKKPTTVREAAVLADEFMLQRNWSYDGVSTSDQP